MIHGFVNGRLEAVVKISIRSSNGTILELDAVIDTGFSGKLSIPLENVSSIGEVESSAGSASLADGTIIDFKMYELEVSWDGQWRPILVSAIGTEALIGMRLLKGFDLDIEVVPGGNVIISTLPGNDSSPFRVS